MVVYFYKWSRAWKRGRREEKKRESGGDESEATEREAIKIRDTFIYPTRLQQTTRSCCFPFVPFILSIFDTAILCAEWWRVRSWFILFRNTSVRRNCENAKPICAQFLWEGKKNNKALFFRIQIELVFFDIPKIPRGGLYVLVFC